MRLNVSWLLLLWRKEGGDCNQAVSKVVVVVFIHFCFCFSEHCVVVIIEESCNLFPVMSFHEALEVVVGFLSSMDFFFIWVLLTLHDVVSMIVVKKGVVSPSLLLRIFEEAIL